MSDTEAFHAQLAGRLAPVVAAAGYELVAAEVAPARRLLRLYIDHHDGIGCDDCAQVSHLVSDWMDAAEASFDGDLAWLAEPSTLEVSSPGLDRPLTKAAHFARFINQDVSIRSLQPLDDTARRKVKGRLLQADASAIVVDDGQTHWPIELANIDRARLVPALPTKE